MPIEPLRPLLPASIHVVEPEVIDAEIVVDEPELPTISVLPEHEAVTRVIALLAVGCKDIFVRSGHLVRVFRPAGPHAVPVIEDVEPAWLCDQISRFAKFCRETRGNLRSCPVPDRLPGMVLARREYPGISPIVAVSESPILTSDGQVHRCGYDATDGVMVLPGFHQATGRMPQAPTIEDAREAVAKLYAVVQDFPFAASPTPDASRAAWLALVLGIIARYAIAGPVPFAVVDASSQASGKGLLVQLTALIATGRHAGVTPCSGEAEELRRAVMPALREGHRIGWLDEVPSPFGGRSWNALCTAWPTYADRVVRTSHAPRMPALTCWIITGNNITLDADSTRRALIIRLEPTVEHPEARDDFRQHNLLGWVESHRAELLEAALTILVAFELAGRPRALRERIGSYECWDDIVRQAVAWVTGHDPLAPRQDMAALVDRGRAAWNRTVRVLRTIFGSTPFTAKESLAGLAGPQGTEAGRVALEELLDGKPVTTKSWGFALRHHRGLIACGLRLEVVNPHGSEGVVYRIRDTRTAQQSNAKEESHGEA